MGAITNQEIKEAWKYAELAYRPAAELNGLFGNAVTTIDPLLPDLGDACHVIDEGWRVVVAFPGSNDWIDWLLNFAALPDDGMHKGFKESIEELADDILVVLDRLRPDKILITGHSRGGGDAKTFLELYAHRLDYAHITCITFAAPRVTTQEFYSIPRAKQLPNVRYVRVHTDADPVPDLPPEKLGWFDDGPVLVITPKVPFWRRFRRWYNEVGHGKIKELVAGNHLVSAYRSAIDKL